jgi:hypothetical protein
LPHRSLGLLVIALGLVVVVVGLLIWSGGFSWFGKLPGDVRIERENLRIDLPIVSMLVISGLLTLLVNLLRRWF